MSHATPRLVAAIAAALLVGPIALADSIELKNGNTIEGKIDSDDRESGGFLVLSIGKTGQMFFRAGEVLQVVESPVATTPPEGPAPVSGGFVEVKLSRGNSFYGDGSYFGTVSPKSDDRKLVLAIPEAGTIEIPRDAVASIAPIDSATLAPAAAVGIAAPASEIATSHVLYLTNGRKVAGNLIDTPVEEPIQLRIGQMGVLLFARDEVESVREESGVIKLPPAPAKTDPVGAPANDIPPPEVQDALRDQLKREILHELLDELLDRRLGTVLGERRAPIAGEVMDSDFLLELQTAVAELGRQRTQFRVRAERKLKTFGSASLPYLEPIVTHPFNLTRRAVQRIVRDIGDPAAAPLSIAALIDADSYVRQIAHESLRKLLPEIVVPYAADAPQQKLVRAQNEYWMLWDEISLEAAKASVLEKLSRR